MCPPPPPPPPPLLRSCCSLQWTIYAGRAHMGLWSRGPLLKETGASALGNVSWCDRTRDVMHLIIAASDFFSYFYPIGSTQVPVWLVSCGVSVTPFLPCLSVFSFKSICFFPHVYSWSVKPVLTLHIYSVVSKVCLDTGVPLIYRFPSSLARCIEFCRYEFLIFGSCGFLHSPPAYSSWRLSSNSYPLSTDGHFTCFIQCHMGATLCTWRHSPWWTSEAIMFFSFHTNLSGP